jgi:protocatechuate 3,4-dioxygenase beta subunit
MQIGLIDVNTCEPIENVLLDIWHCDALGKARKVSMIP